jgi:endonuclease YncB( thermonuclease family)
MKPKKPQKIKKRYFKNQGKEVLVILALLSLIVVPYFVFGVSAGFTRILSGNVERVPDGGDTLRIAGFGHPVRLWGIDTSTASDASPDEAADYLRRLVAEQLVTCEWMSLDPRRRYVGRCKLPDGRDLASELISAGHAKENCLFSSGHYGTCSSNK